jgi:hypothetical protein
MNSIWTPELDARLAELWADRALGTQSIGAMLGLTKNQVIGRADRLSLPPRDDPGLAKANEARKRMQTLRATPDPGCRWIEGDDHLERQRRGEPICCGKPIAPESSSYCATHHRRAYARRKAV